MDQPPQPNQGLPFDEFWDPLFLDVQSDAPPRSSSDSDGDEDHKMVNYMLIITAEIKNLTNLQPKGGCDDPSFMYCFKMKCGKCEKVSEKETCVSLNKTVPLASGNVTNLVQKCEFCGKEGSVKMIGGKGRPLTQKSSESGKYSPLMLFDCKLYEPLDFKFRRGWKIESLEGTAFDEIDLSEGKFEAFDEKGQCPVKISNLRAMFLRRKSVA